MPNIKTPKSKIDPKLCYSTKVVVTDGGMVQIKAYDFPIYRKEQREESTLQALQSTSAEQNQATARSTMGRQSADSSELKQISASSVARTRNSLIEFASQNRYVWKSFITLTFAENVTDVSEANKVFHAWVKDTARNCKRHGMEFKYITVPEFQDRGAVHYHLLTNLPCDSDLVPKRPPIKTHNIKKDKWYTLEYYDIPYWRVGNSSAFDLDMTDENFNVALYITKYLYKDIDHRLFGHTKFMHSHNLTKPDKYYLLDDQVYLDAMAYIEQKGYDLKQYRHESKGDYDRAMDIYTAHMIAPDDLDAIRDILNGNSNTIECEERKETNGNYQIERRTLQQSLQCSECQQIYAEGEDLQGIRPKYGDESLRE